jgi:hypothetical protein
VVLASLRFAEMKFPLFKRDGSKQVQLAAQEQIEKLLAESFRALGHLFTKTAELIEAQRLERTGYGEQERFLERVEGKEPPQP